MSEINKDKKIEFSEKIYSAITNIDDMLLEEAESYTPSEIKNVCESSEAPKKEQASQNTSETELQKDKKQKKKNSKKYILTAACLAVVILVSVPVISKVVKSNQKDAGPSDSSISENLVEKASDKKASDKTDNDSDGRKKETVNSVAANGPIEEKNGLTLNSYTGHGLDGSTYGTKEIFSTMKSSTLPTYGECFIVAVNNETTGEVIKIFSATGYELKMAFAGNCLDDVLERIDID